MIKEKGVLGLISKIQNTQRIQNDGRTLIVSRMEVSISAGSMFFCEA